MRSELNKVTRVTTTRVQVRGLKRLQEAITTAETARAASAAASAGGGGGGGAAASAEVVEEEADPAGGESTRLPGFGQLHTLLVDPPRSGMDSLTCNIASWFRCGLPTTCAADGWQHAEQAGTVLWCRSVVYISCNPETLVRDIGMIAALRPVKVSAIDCNRNGCSPKDICQWVESVRPGVQIVLERRATGILVAAF